MAVATLSLIGVLIPAFLSWARDRDLGTQKMKQVDLALKGVAFWKNWHSSILPLDSGNDAKFWTERARSQMWLASCTVEKIFQQQTTNKKESLFVKSRLAYPKWKRWLLVYLPPEPRAWTPRILFYAYAFLIPVFIPSMISSQVAQLDSEITESKAIRTAPNDGRSSPLLLDEGMKQVYIDAAVARKKEYLSTVAIRLGGYTFFSVVLGLVFRWLSVWLENKTNPEESI